MNSSPKSNSSTKVTSVSTKQTKLKKVLTTPIIAPQTGPSTIRQFLLQAATVQLRILHSMMVDQISILNVKTAVLNGKDRLRA